MVHSDAGCSRTLPVASSWNGQDSSMIGNNNLNNGIVKRELLTSVPCQVAEVSTSLHTNTAVKIEPVLPKSENGESLLLLISIDFSTRIRGKMALKRCVVSVKMKMSVGIGNNI